MSAIAIAALVVVLYTYLGYPLLVVLWARLFHRATSPRDGYEPTVSICFSVHDGAGLVTQKLRSLQALDYAPDKLEFLVFSDGSTDDTEQCVRDLARVDPRIRFLSSPTRRGKPTALNRLRRAATGDVLLLCDVRQSFAPGSLRALVRPLSDPSVGCVSGNLVLRGTAGAGAYWRYEQLIRRAEARLGRMVGVSGSIYSVRRSEMPILPEDILLDDMFVPLHIAFSRRKSIVLAEEAEAYDDACDDLREFTRKVRTLAGNYQLIARMPFLLLPGRSPVWFQMISHKLLRLACPWALVLLLGSSAALAIWVPASPMETSFWRTVFSAEVTFFILAALGPKARRMGTLPRTFLVLNGAALVGTWRFLRGSQAITW